MFPSKNRVRAEQYNLVQREDDVLVDSLARQNIAPEHRLRADLSAGRLPLVTRDGVMCDTVRPACCEVCAHPHEVLPRPPLACRQSVR
jgi:hypothetical protein